MTQTGEMACVFLYLYRRNLQLMVGHYEKEISLRWFRSTDLKRSFELRIAHNVGGPFLATSLMFLLFGAFCSVCSFSFHFYS